MMMPVGGHLSHNAKGRGLNPDKRRGHYDVNSLMSSCSSGPQQLNSYYNVNGCATGYHIHCP